MSAATVVADDWAPETVAWFAEGWRAPSYEQFCAYFLTRMDPEVRLIQPLARTGVGHDAFRAQFARLFAAIPDIHARVLRWSARGDDVFIELELEGTIGGRPIRWQTCDRLTLRDGLVVERRSFFDPGPLVAAFAMRPWAWPRLIVSTARVSLCGRHAGSLS